MVLINDWLSFSGIVCTCAFLTAEPALLLALLSSLCWDSWRTSREVTYQQWLSQVRVKIYKTNASAINKPSGLTWNACMIVTKCTPNSENSCTLVHMFCFFTSWSRSWPCIYCLSSCSGHDASTSALGHSFFPYDHLTWVRQSGKYWNLFNSQKLVSWQLSAFSVSVCRSGGSDYGYLRHASFLLSCWASA